MFEFGRIEYTRPDFEKAEAETEEYIKKFKAAKTYAQAKKLFSEHCAAGDELASMYNIAYIRNTSDMDDKFYEGEINFFNERMPAYGVVESRAGEALLASPFRAEFEKDFGANLIKDIEAGVRLNDERIIAEQVEEANLQQEYSKCVAACKTDFMGEECNFYGLLKHMESTDGSVRRAAFLKWAELYESVSEKLDGVYTRLVALRKTMAQKLGFKNFVETAYLANGHYYYNADDVAAFRKQILETVVPAANKLYEEQRIRLGVDKLHYYDEPLCFPEGNAQPAGSMNYLVQSASEMYAEMSKESGEFFNFMTSHSLFDLDTRAGKHQGGYCTYIPKYKAPFIFSNFNGTSADVDVLTHEAGHAFQAYMSSRILPLSSQIWATSDVCEIHSMTMELFAYPYMEKFFGKNADKYRFSHLSGTIKTLPYLCLVDHFQHEVFANDFTAAERRACWRRLEKIYMPWRSYDGNAFLEEGGFWMQKQHIFLNPFYYVDYALAQIGAYELYSRSHENKEKAWEDYLNLCRAGGSKGYFELLHAGNLSNPFKDGAVEKAVRGILSELAQKK